MALLRKRQKRVQAIEIADRGPAIVCTRTIQHRDNQRAYSSRGANNANLRADTSSVTRSRLARVRTRIQMTECGDSLMPCHHCHFLLASLPHRILRRSYSGACMCATPRGPLSIHLLRSTSQERLPRHLRSPLVTEQPPAEPENKRTRQADPDTCRTVAQKSLGQLEWGAIQVRPTSQSVCKT
jgi:hypothetical protein